MKFNLAIVSALVGFAVAAPAPSPDEPASSGSCTPATYACLPGKTGWQVCDTSGHWVFAGNCPPKTECVFYPPSLSPYCVPPGFKMPAGP